MSSKASNTVVSPGPIVSLLSGVLFIAAGAGWFFFERSATFGYDGSQPYDYITESISDLGVPYKQLHIIKVASLTSYRAANMNFGLYWYGILFTLAQSNLLLQTRNQVSSGAGMWRTYRVLLSLLYTAGMVLIATIHGGTHEEHWKIIGWHWMGFALVAFAGNLHSILAVLPPSQMGFPDGNLIYSAISVILAVIGIGSYFKFNMLGKWTSETPLGLWQRGILYPVSIWQIITGIGLILGAVMGPAKKGKQA